MFSGYFYISDIIKNRDVLMTIIVMSKFTQTLRSTLECAIHAQNMQVPPSFFANVSKHYFTKLFITKVFYHTALNANCLENSRLIGCCHG